MTKPDNITADVKKYGKEWDKGTIEIPEVYSKPDNIQGDVAKAIYKYFTDDYGPYTYAAGTIDNITLDGQWDCGDIAKAAIAALQVGDKDNGELIERIDNSLNLIPKIIPQDKNDRILILSFRDIQGNTIEECDIGKLLIDCKKALEGK